MHPHSREFSRLFRSVDWKKADAARELGLDPSVIGRYLKEEAIPSLTVLKLLAERTGLPLELAGEPPRMASIRDGPRWLEEWESGVVLSLRRLDPQTRREVIAGINQILNAVVRSERYKPPAHQPLTVPTVVASMMNRMASEPTGSVASGPAETATPPGEPTDASSPPPVRPSEVPAVEPSNPSPKGGGRLRRSPLEHPK